MRKRRSTTVKVSVVIPTRGDHDLTPILDSLSGFDDIVIWDNSKRENLSVYGRYAAITEARHPLILTQDDDVIVSDPELIVRCWMSGNSFDSSGMIRQARAVRPDLACNYKEAAWVADAERGKIRDWGYVACNMPPEFRHDFYSDHALVGFGACFHRDLPEKAFGRLRHHRVFGLTQDSERLFNRTCDIVFTALTPRVLVDVPIAHLPYASDPNRMWKQPEHQGERQRMLDLVRKVRDA